MADNRLLLASVFGGLLAVGLIGGGALIGQGVVNARVGDRSVSVRGLAERNVKADLALLPLKFTPRAMFSRMSRPASTVIWPLSASS